MNDVATVPQLAPGEQATRASFKCVVVIDQHLPLGIIANTAAVLCVSVGKLFPTLIGRDLQDHSGDRHLGITTAPIPILKGTAESLKKMRESLKQHEPEVTVLDLISATQVAHSYDQYAHELQRTPLEDLQYQGLALCGPTKLVNKFTGSLGLLR
jgi:hypothetical protein